jgi:hypothetical protein
VSEGLSGTEAGKEISEHAKHSSTHHATDRRYWIVSIAEAVLLSLVTLAAAWSGYAAAKWNSESSDWLTAAVEARTDASRADLDAREDRNFDLSTFEAWFDAYVAGDQHAMALAARRFRPEFAVAFSAWRATSPDTNPTAPRGPTYMPQYRQPRLAEAKALDEKRTMRTPQDRPPTERPTSTSGPPCSSPACSSWWASARTSQFGGRGMGSSHSVLWCSWPPSYS